MQPVPTIVKKQGISQHVLSNLSKCPAMEEVVHHSACLYIPASSWYPAWYWQKQLPGSGTDFPQNRHTNTQTFTPAVSYFSVALLNTPLTRQTTCTPSSTAALIYHWLFRLRPQARAPKITHRGCPVVASAPGAPNHRLICRNHPQGGLVHIVPSTSIVLQSCVKRLVYLWLREKHIFSAYFYVFIITNEVARKDNSAIDILKKSIIYSPQYFFF